MLPGLPGQAMLKTRNASEAYRASYVAGAMAPAPATVNRKAHDLLANGKIAARLAELRARWLSLRK